MELAEVVKSLETIEAKLKEFSDKATEEIKSIGKVSTDTNAALDALGVKQREFADEILQLKQRGLAGAEETKDDESMGAVFTKSDQYAAFASGQSQKARMEVKNTVTNPVGNTFSDRRPGIVTGAFRPLTLESLLPSLPTTSNAVDYVRENVFTNAAAEAAEGVARAESSITTTLVTEPVANVGHWIKISRQLASDNAALAAYINLRMTYGVDLRVENQIMAGDGIAPNMSGFTKAGNFTAHGYTDASLTGAGLMNNRFDLIGKMIGDCWAADYPADVVALNPTDWWTMRLAKDANNNYIMGDPASGLTPMLWGVPVVASNAVTADNVMVASLANAATMYNREGVMIELSESDSDNFTKKLVTILAERRTMLAVERPAAVRYGDLTPA
jgi:HK97 family phage major capsid protein